MAFDLRVLLCRTEDLFRRSGIIFSLVRVDVCAPPHLVRHDDLEIDEDLDIDWVQAIRE